MTTSLSYQEIMPGARLFLSLVRGQGRGQDLSPGPLADLLPDASSQGLARALATASGRDLPRRDLADRIRRRMVVLDAPEAALTAADRLALPGSAVVVTGQQPGLLGGPLMVLAKALTAIATARRLEQEHGGCVVPVFWSAAEDHDHAEADHVDIVRAGRVERLRLRLPEDRRMLSHVPVPDTTEVLAALGPHGERAAPRPGDSMADWSARLLLQLLGPHGLVLVEPATIAPFARGVLAHELERPGELAASVREAEERVRAAGFSAPLDLPRDELFFVVQDGRRLVARATAGGFELVTGEKLETSELLDRLAAEPGSFSWNVASRVLAQDLALPVAAQICGPSELAYVGLLGDAHRLLGIPRPVALPRAGVTLVPPRIARACRGLGVSPADVVRRGAAALPKPGSGAEPPELSALREAVARLPESTDKGVARRRAALQRDTDLYAQALEREAAQADGALVAKRERVLAALRPRNVLQERTVSALPWILGHGEQVVTDMLAAISTPGAEHVIVDLGTGTGTSSAGSTTAGPEENV